MEDKFPDNAETLFENMYPQVPIQNLKRIDAYLYSTIYLYYFDMTTLQIYFYNINGNWGVVPQLLYTQLIDFIPKEFVKKYDDDDSNDASLTPSQSKCKAHRVLSITNPRDLLGWFQQQNFNMNTDDSYT